MSNLISHTKFPALLAILVLSLLTITSCKKKKKTEPEPSVTAQWKEVNSVDFIITSMEVFNNELYIAGLKPGSTYDIPVLKKITSDFSLVDFHNDEFSQVNTGNNTPLIYKLYASSDKLYIGGNFKFSINNATSLMYYDQTGNFTPIPLFTQNASYVSSFCDFQNALILGGSFNTNDPLVTSENTMKIQNDVPSGFGDFPASVTYLTSHSNQLFGIGTKKLQKWNGTNWIDEAYNNPVNSDELFNICSYHDELYLAGRFANSVLLKKMDSSGVWKDVPGFTFANSARLKVIDDKLYLFGSFVTFNGKNTSDVLVYEGNTWNPLGNLSAASVSNLVKFNGELICTAQSKLYSLK